MSMKVVFYATPLVFAALVAVVLLLAWWPALVAAGTSVAVIIVVVAVVLALSVAVAAITGVFNVVAGTFFGLKNRSVELEQRRQEMSLAEREQAHRHEMDRIAASRFIIRASHDSRETAILPELGIIAAQLPAPAPELPANVPHHYAPSWSISVAKPTTKEERAALSSVDQALLSAPDPGKMDLLDCLDMMQHGKMFLGVNLESAAPINVTWADTLHTALAGSTGKGKTVLVRLLMLQYILLGVRVYLADPHFAEIDPKSKEDWRPLAARLAAPPAVTYDEIATLVKWVCDEMAKRYVLRRQGKDFGPPIVLFVEELPAVIHHRPEVAVYMALLLREARKVDIFFAGAAQDVLTKTLGVSGGIRECFQTAYYVGGDATSARVLLDLPPKTNIDEATLGKGVVMLRCSATPEAARVRVPYVSNESLYRLLGKPEEEITEQPTSGSGSQNLEARPDRNGFYLVRDQEPTSDQDDPDEINETDELNDLDRQVLLVLQGDFLEGKTGDKAIAEYLSETGPTKISHNAINRSKAKLARLRLISA